jgi:hypothetical protein
MSKLCIITHPALMLTFFGECFMGWMKPKLTFINCLMMNASKSHLRIIALNCKSIFNIETRDQLEGYIGFKLFVMTNFPKKTVTKIQ